MNWIKDALIERKRRELVEQLRGTGAALGDLLQNEAALGDIPPEAAWTLLNGLETSLKGLNRAVRAARGHTLPASARRALGEVTYTLGEVSELLERYAVPAAENVYGLPPPGTRWRMEPEGKGEDAR